MPAIAESHFITRRQALMSPGAKDRIRGLYVIMNTASVPADDFNDTARRVLEGGASIIQYRDKSDDTHKRSAQARALTGLCRTFGALLIINDDPLLAHESGADGVHVGCHDESVRKIRRTYPGMIIGASCYDSLDIAANMVDQGASYLAFGSFYPSPTKPMAVPVKPDVLVQAGRKFNVPLVAIGGIVAENAGALIESGADAVAVISAVLDSDDPGRASRNIASLFSNNEEHAMNPDNPSPDS